MTDYLCDCKMNCIIITAPEIYRKSIYYMIFYSIQSKNIHKNHEIDTNQIKGILSQLTSLSIKPSGCVLLTIWIHYLCSRKCIVHLWLLGTKNIPCIFGQLFRMIIGISRRRKIYCNYNLHAHIDYGKFNNVLLRVK